MTLERDLDKPEHSADWHYRTIIGKLNFLEKSTRPNLAVSVHSCARFSVDPRKSHTDAVHNIGRYLVGNGDKGIIIAPNDHSFDVYADADFCGLWNKETAMEDPSTAKSRTGYVILYANCPIVWASKLQTETALSTTESEYMSLSSALRETILLMQLINESKANTLLSMTMTPTVH